MDLWICVCTVLHKVRSQEQSRVLSTSMPMYVHITYTPANGSFA